MFKNNLTNLATQGALATTTDAQIIDTAQGVARQLAEVALQIPALRGTFSGIEIANSLSTGTVAILTTFPKANVSQGRDAKVARHFLGVMADETHDFWKHASNVLNAGLRRNEELLSQFEDEGSAAFDALKVANAAAREANEKAKTARYEAKGRVVEQANEVLSGSGFKAYRANATNDETSVLIRDLINPNSPQVFNLDEPEQVKAFWSRVVEIGDVWTKELEKRAAARAEIAAKLSA